VFLSHCDGYYHFQIALWEYEKGRIPRVKRYWEIISEKLSAAGWSWGYCSAVKCNGWRYVVDAYREGSHRYVVESGELLTAFLHLEATLL